MATTKDYSTVPAVITITNIDPGVIDKENTKVVEVETTVEGVTTKTQEVQVAYLTEPQTQQIQLYRVNLWVPVDPEDKIKIVAQTSEEVAYYSLMASDRIQVEVEAVTEG